MDSQSTQPAPQQQITNEINFQDIFRLISGEGDNDGNALEVEKEANDLLNSFVHDYIANTMEDAIKIAKQDNKNEIDEDVLNKLLAQNFPYYRKQLNLPPQEKEAIYYPQPLSVHQDRMEEIRKFKEAKKNGNM